MLLHRDALRVAEAASTYFQVHPADFALSTHIMRRLMEVFTALRVEQFRMIVRAHDQAIELIGETETGGVRALVMPYLMKGDI